MIVSLFPELTQKGFFIINKKLCLVYPRLLNWTHAPTARSKQTRLATLLACTGASVRYSAGVAWREVNDRGGILFFAPFDGFGVVVDSEYLLHGSNYKGFLSMVKHQCQKDFLLSRGCCRSRCNDSGHVLRDTRLCVLCYPKNQLPIGELLALRHLSNP